ncbi:hypothetical protein CC86DRAFT_377828 [Ophiobolus disseminans]|uniref:Uncharacterized protein n=1 Tax=Ophiobolus disseminans TaxID=1469910 RepID=A0A6A7AJD6_9PLEO|nr:hypothetical protein CC86DRAFT_377828 [Ophiobolus disseminans]
MAKRYRNDDGDDDFIPGRRPTKKTRRARPTRPGANAPPVANALAAAQQQANVQHNATSRLSQLPGEVRNRIYQLILDDWHNNNNARVLSRRQFGGVPPLQTHLDNHITNAAYPFLLTPESAVPLPRAPFQNLAQNIMQAIALAGQQRALTNHEYHAYVNDLFNFARVSQQFRAEYMGFLHTRVAAFVRMEEMGLFLNTFYPVTGPADPQVANYNGLPLTIILPWDTLQMWDITALLRFLMRATNMRTHTWAANSLFPHPQSTLTNGRQIGRTLFGWTGSLRSYMANPANPTINRVRFRAYGYNIGQRAQLEIWFDGGANGQGGPDWVDGETWAWPYPENSVRQCARTTAARVRRTRLGQFLRDAGLVVPDIRRYWIIRLGIDGKHRVGGSNF